MVVLDLAAMFSSVINNAFLAKVLESSPGPISFVMFQQQIKHVILRSKTIQREGRGGGCESGAGYAHYRVSSYRLLLRGGNVGECMG